MLPLALFAASWSWDKAKLSKANCSSAIIKQLEAVE
jgi:hypothetical protein